MDPAPPREENAFSAAIRSARDRILSGLLLALPIAITAWVFYWLYSTLRRFILDPSADVVRWLLGPAILRSLPPWWDSWGAPILGGAIVLALLYVLGYIARSRISRALDWVLFRIPLVTIVYKAVRDVFQSLGRQDLGASHNRVVLVPFPHPGSKALGFITQTLRDGPTGRTIYCVSVLTGLVPPAGFTLFVPEEEAIELDWSVNQALQAILSGGMTSPSIINYFQSSPAKAPIPGASAADRPTVPRA